MPKTLEEYLRLPYTIILRRDPQDGIVVARVEELSGCSAHGDSEEEALTNIRDSMADWIADCLEVGDPVPEPAEEVELPSGKWLQRVPRSLHLKLIRLAQQEGVSLNQLVTTALAEAAGAKQQARSVLLSQMPQAPGVSYKIQYVGAFGPTRYNYDIKGEIGLIHFSPESEAYIGHVISGAPKKASIMSPERRMYAENA
jgi:antitoxin HicB